MKTIRQCFFKENPIGKPESFKPTSHILSTFTFPYSCLLHLRHSFSDDNPDPIHPTLMSKTKKKNPHASPTSSSHRRQRRPFRSTRPGSRAVMRTFRSPSSPRYRRRSPSRTIRSARWPRAAPEWKPRRVTARWSGRYPWRRSSAPPCAV